MNSTICRNPKNDMRRRGLFVFANYDSFDSQNKRRMFPEISLADWYL